MYFIFDSRVEVELINSELDGLVVETGQPILDINL